MNLTIEAVVPLPITQPINTEPELHMTGHGHYTSVCHLNIAETVSRFLALVEPKAGANAK
jgi:hypothetical protein